MLSHRRWDKFSKIAGMNARIVLSWVDFWTVLNTELLLLTVGKTNQKNKKEMDVTAWPAVVLVGYAEARNDKPASTRSSDQSLNNFRHSPSENRSFSEIYNDDTARAFVAVSLLKKLRICNFRLLFLFIIIIVHFFLKTPMWVGVNVIYVINLSSS